MEFFLTKPHVLVQHEFHDLRYVQTKLLLESPSPPAISPPEILKFSMVFGC